MPGLLSHAQTVTKQNVAGDERKPTGEFSCVPRASWQTVDRARLAELAAPRVATGGEGCGPR